ncbi:hypothetical protein VN97_g12047 [Penicillium thymicola]|uniref:Integrase catalytic domain-containing protein n=1 Tax=Penicillium thymicola TaxID=293382 RepID=A0AAI9T6P1_PENTH|nr:hypothetical protein VN97_g12047 [Penicillium thymicola]
MVDSRGGPTNPKFSDLVPSLKGESNWESWKQCIEIALNGIDLSYWPLLIGRDERPANLPGMEEEAEFGDTVTELDDDAFTTASFTSASSTSTTQPAAQLAAQPASKTAMAKQKKAQQAWDQNNAIVLSFIAASLDANMLVYVKRGNTAAMVYEELRALCEAKTFFSVGNKAIKWAAWKYKPGIKPEDFVTKWRYLFTEKQEAFPAKQRVSPLFAMYMFLHAVSNNTACQHWLNTVSIRDDWSYDKNLHNIFGDFIAAEGRRIGNDRSHSQPQQQASSNVASSTRKKGFKDKSFDKGKGKGKERSTSRQQKEDDDRTLYHCSYHDRPSTHKPADCFLTPKNKYKDFKDKGRGRKGGKKPKSANPAAANAASKGDDNLWVSATHVVPRFLVTDSNGVTHDIHEYDNQPALSSSGASLAPGAFPAPRLKPLDSNAMSTYTFRSDNDVPDPNVWMLDSGCSAHMTPCRSVFHTFTQESLPIRSATGETFYAEGYGDVVIDLAIYNYAADEQGTKERIRMGGIVLRKVWYAPSLKHSLISTRQLAANGTMTIQLFKDHAELKSMVTGEVKGYASVSNNQYWLYTFQNAHVSHLRSLMEANCLTRSLFSPSSRAKSTGSAEDDNLYVSAARVGEPTSIDMNLAHRRACHAGETRVRKTQECTDGLTLKGKSALTRPCGPCVLGKGHALPFGKDKSIRTKPGEFLHTDVWGPISIASTGGGYNYYVTFTDDASRFCWVFLLKHRSEVLDKFIQVEQWLKTQLDLTVKRVAGDNAKEHEPLRDYLISKGAVWDPVPPYTPRLNGIPEIKNKHLLEPLVAIMSEHELPKYLWGPIIQGVNYTQNRLYHSKIECTPFEKLYGHKPNIAHLRALGCQCWYMIPKERRQQSCTLTQLKGACLVMINEVTTRFMTSPQRRLLSRETWFSMKHLLIQHRFHRQILTPASSSPNRILVMFHSISLNRNRPDYPPRSPAFRFDRWLQQWSGGTKGGGAGGEPKGGPCDRGTYPGRTTSICYPGDNPA